MRIFAVAVVSALFDSSHHVVEALISPNLGSSLGRKFTTYDNFHTSAQAGQATRLSSPENICSRNKSERLGRNTGATVLMMAKIPTIDEWKVIRSGSVVGTVSNHPSIPNGDVITTSPLEDLEALGENVIVTTQSGSKYKLGNKEGKPKAVRKPQVEKPTKEPASREKPVAAEMSLQEAKRKARGLYDLNGRAVGNGRYLLSGKPVRSTSGKSMIWSAFVADDNGLPTMEGAMELAIKTTTNKEAIAQEYQNYQKVTRGLFPGQFVKIYDYMQNAEGQGFESQSALVMEKGQMDLKALLAARNGQPLTGRAMRDTAAAALQCLQAMHTSNFVWTDLKSENFVVTSMTLGDENAGLPGVKGIDLESARKMKDNPVDYSPEACPPEFAEAFVLGDGADFVLEGSYDIWSYGMMLYELSTGRPYFGGKSPLQITKLLRLESFQADVSAVPDDALRDLISSCLSRDARKRPNVAQISLHPYFLTTGIGPISF